MALGYAATGTDGDIVVDTVSSTERAAMINWLAVAARFPIARGMDDFAIREHFARRAPAAGIKIARVQIILA